MESITLQTNDTIVTSGDFLGQLQFAASSESDGGASQLVVARIYSQAEGAFSASSNPASIIFATSSDDSLAASGKIKIDDNGNILPLQSYTYNVGNSGLEFLRVHAATGYFSIIQFNTNNGSVNSQGQIGWNSTEGTVDIALTDSTVMEIGQHRFFRVRNTTGSPLYKGQVVYASGVHPNGIITPNLYIANGTISEIRFIGLVFDTINDNNNGYVVDFGHLRDLDLDGSATDYAVGDETWSDGDILYAHPTVSGKLTNVEPKHAISVAIILDNSSVNGQLFVRPTNFGDLSFIHDVDVSGVTNGQFLQYNSVTDYWVASSSGNFTTLQVNGTAVPTGTGSSNFVTRWIDTNSLGTGVLYDNGINVGVGTNTPSYKLHVVGTGYITGDVIVDGNVTVNGTTTTVNVDRMEVEDPILTLGLASGNIVTSTTLDRGLALILSTGLTAFMGWDQSLSEFSLLSSGVESSNSGIYSPGTYGNLHAAAFIGTSGNFSSDVTVGGSLTVRGTGVVVGSGISNHIAYWSDNGVITSDSGQLYWDAVNNRLGLGVSAPTQKLDVRGSAYVSGYIQLGDTVGTTGNKVQFFRGGGSAFDYSIGKEGNHLTISTADDSGTIRYTQFGYHVGGTTWTPQVVVNNYNGGIGIRTTSPSYQLHVNGSGFFASGLVVNGNLTVNGTGVVTGVGTSGYLAKWNSSNRITSGIIYESGTNVGIGTTSPTYKLQVNGSFGATTKSFNIAHPSKPGYRLEYGSLESPYHGVRLTGKDTVVNGKSIIQLPEYIKDLVYDEDLNIQLTNYKHGKVLYVDDIDLENNQFIVKCNSWFSNNLEFFWTFSAVRKDVERLIVERKV